MVVGGHLSLAHATMWQVKSDFKSPKLTFSGPAHSHPCLQGQLHCASQAGTRLALPSASVGEGLDQLSRLPWVAKDEGGGHLSLAYAIT